MASSSVISSSAKSPSIFSALSLRSNALTATLLQLISARVSISRFNSTGTVIVMCVVVSFDFMLCQSMYWHIFRYLLHGGWSDCAKHQILCNTAIHEPTSIVSSEQKLVSRSNFQE